MASHWKRALWVTFECDDLLLLDLFFVFFLLILCSFFFLCGGLSTSSASLHSLTLSTLCTLHLAPSPKWQQQQQQFSSRDRTMSHFFLVIIVTFVLQLNKTLPLTLSELSFSTHCTLLCNQLYFPVSCFCLRTAKQASFTAFTWHGLSGARRHRYDGGGGTSLFSFDTQ